MKSRDTEIREAIQAAENTLQHLSEAQRCLSSAGNWGLVDMLGGGFFTTLMKRNKMNNAQAELQAARDAIHSFASELRDVESVADINVEVNDFLGFADVFFDGVVADWMMQSRINTAKSQVTEAIAKVQTIRDDLLRML